MDKDYLKELLNTYRSDKGHLWNSLIVVVSGTVGLIIRALNVKNNALEIFFAVIGILLIFLLLYFISEFIKRINETLDKLKKGD